MREKKKKSLPTDDKIKISCSNSTFVTKSKSPRISRYFLFFSETINNQQKISKYFLKTREK